jgi:hypothetical protein
VYGHKGAYEAVAGQFTQEDPLGLGGGLNEYGFANGDPVNNTDPFGLCPPKDDKPCTAVNAYGEGRNTVIRYDDGTEQVRAGGTRSWRNNNPGNMRNTRFSKGQGSLGEAGGFAVFPDTPAGEGALTNLLDTDVYQGLSVDGAVNRYAPPSENNTTAYQNNIRSMTGLPGSTKMSTLTAAQIRAVANAIQRIEGWQEGSVTYRMIHQ